MIMIMNKKKSREDKEEIENADKKGENRDKYHYTR